MQTYEDMNRTKNGGDDLQMVVHILLIIILSCTKMILDTPTGHSNPLSLSLSLSLSDKYHQLILYRNFQNLFSIGRISHQKASITSSQCTRNKWITVDNQVIHPRNTFQIHKNLLVTNPGQCILNYLLNIHRALKYQNTPCFAFRSTYREWLVFCWYLRESIVLYFVR